MWICLERDKKPPNTGIMRAHNFVNETTSKWATNTENAQIKGKLVMPVFRRNKTVFAWLRGIGSVSSSNKVVHAHFITTTDTHVRITNPYSN